MKRIFVALTGASGIVYGLKLISELRKSNIEVFVTATKNAIKNAEVEFEQTYVDVRDMLDKHNITDVVIYDEHDTAASPASGSFKIDAYIVAPASMGFVGRVNSGVSINIAERCADVALKEGKPLLILFRETPLSLIHLENLTNLAKAGAIIMPASPAFYHAPKTIDELVCFTVGKMLDRLGIDNSLFKRWQ